MVPTTSQPGSGASNPSAPSKLETAPSLFDASHFPTLLPRILSIRSLLNDATASSDALVRHVDARGGEEVSSGEGSGMGRGSGVGAQRVATGGDDLGGPSSATDRPTFSLTLGATSDEDDTFVSLFSTNASSSSSSSGNSIAPTPLHATLVTEARELREAFARAQSSLEGLEGGELSLRDQERVLQTLEGYVRGLREGNRALEGRIAGRTQG